MEPIQQLELGIGIIIVLVFIWLLLKGKKERRREFTEAEKQAILERQRGTDGIIRCAMCGDTDYKYFQFHHKIPFCEGGETCVDNGAGCCAKCHDIFTRARNGKE